MTQLSKEEIICLEITKSLIETDPDADGKEIVDIAVAMTYEMLVQLRIKGEVIHKNFRETMT